MLVSEKQVERLSERIGLERVAERDAEVEAFQKLPLTERCDGVPKGVTSPSAEHVAVVMADAGMLQLRDDEEADAANAILAFPTTTDTPATSAPTEDAAASSSAEDDADVEPTKRHWHEDKVGVVMTMKSAARENDPCPQIPLSFLNPQKIPNLVRGLKARAALGEDGLEAGEPDAVEEVLKESPEYEAPQLETRVVAASRQSWPLFGPILATAAWLQGFTQATRKAFVADGAAAIWRLRERFFSTYVPILDFIHALSYVYAAAMAIGGDVVRGWPLYVEWITWVWEGRVARVIEALSVWQGEHAEEKDGATAAVVQRSFGYLSRHQDKMKYDEYRQAGLPITSSLIESMVKQIGRRVKGTEKFWSEDGAEAILQLRGDYLSDGEVMEDYWQRRQDEATGQRAYRKTA